MLLLVLGALACINMEKCFMHMSAAETCACEILLAFVEKRFGGEELMY